MYAVPYTWHICFFREPLSRGLLVHLLGWVHGQVGFFAEAGPLQLFVSNHLIPEDYTFKGLPEPSFISADETVTIAPGTEVRVRVVGSRMEATTIVCLLSILRVFLSIGRGLQNGLALTEGFRTELSRLHFDGAFLPTTLLQVLRGKEDWKGRLLRIVT